MPDINSLLAMQVVFSDPDVLTLKADETSAYQELQNIIKGCLDLNFKTRLAVKDVQSQLFQIMQQRDWTSNMLDALPSADADESGVS